MDNNVKKNRVIIVLDLLALISVYIFQQSNAAGSKSAKPKNVTW
jgi:hypothetical protein